MSGILVTAGLAVRFVVVALMPHGSKVNGWERLTLSLVWLSSVSNPSNKCLALPGQIFMVLHKLRLQPQCLRESTAFCGFCAMTCVNVRNIYRLGLCMPQVCCLFSPITSSLLACRTHSLQQKGAVVQGTVQATLAAAPLQLVQIYHADSSKYVAAAETIAVTGVMYILLGSTLAWLSAAFLAPAVLTKVSICSL